MSEMKFDEHRLWAKIEKTEGCWNWTAAKNAKGYGSFGVGNGRTMLAHRVTYQLFNSEVPAGMVLDHTCHNRGCVNPSHLRLVTQKQNMENRAGAQRNSSSGVRGVSWCDKHKKWRASVNHLSTQITVGYYRTIEEAEPAVIAKRLELFTHNDLDRSNGPS